MAKDCVSEVDRKFLANHFLADEDWGKYSAPECGGEGEFLLLGAVVYY